MILNLGSLAFNANIAGGGGTPAWGTELGQGEGYRFAFEDMSNFFTGMVYSSIPNISDVTCPLGKGGKQQQDYDFVIASLFTKIFVNDKRVPDARFILLVVKKIVGEHHVGRRTIKYNPRMTYKGEEINDDCYRKMAFTLGLKEESAWFVNELDIRNQDELHFYAYVLGNSSKEYESNDMRRNDFLSKLPKNRLNTGVELIKKDISSSLIPYLTAIRTKPFLLLAGISGTGKSRIVRKLAQATNDIDFAAGYDGEDRWKKHNPTNFCLIQVKPNWHNPMDVVGFKSNIGSAHYEFTTFIEFIAKAWHYPDTPFFLCLDEMNLAPVEEYFAEFLSAIETRSINKDGEYETDPIVNPFDSFGPEVSGQMIAHLVDQDLDAGCKLENQFRKKGLTLPKNIIVMGTVNMDETTFSFSRKVLDRAMSIEMNEVDYDAFLMGETEEDVPLLTGCNKMLVERPINAQIVKNDIEADKIIGYLKSVNALLDGTPFKLGYRAANEAFLYVSASKMFGSDDLASALDKFTLMKILSRIEGDDSKLKTKSGDDLLPELLNLLTTQFGEDGKSVSVQKLTEMNDILTRDHFVSFWG